MKPPWKQVPGWFRIKYGGLYGFFGRFRFGQALFGDDQGENILDAEGGDEVVEEGDEADADDGAADDGSQGEGSEFTASVEGAAQHAF